MQAKGKEANPDTDVEGSLSSLFRPWEPVEAPELQEMNLSFLSPLLLPHEFYLINVMACCKLPIIWPNKKET